MYTDLTLTNSSTTACREGWTYWEGKDRDSLVPYNGVSIATQWNLVCDKLYLKDFTQSTLVFGVMVGATGFSALSDYFGRKPVFLFSQWAMVVVGTANAFVTNYYAYAVLRFFTGALQQGIILTGFVLACELFQAKHRTFAGIIIEDFWGVASCVLPLFAYIIVDWHYLQLLISLSGLLTIPMYWLMPESLIWLCANDRHREAEQIIRNAAKMNNIEMPENILAMPPLSPEAEAAQNGSGFFAKLKNIKKLRVLKKEETAAVYTLLDIFRNKRLLIYALIMAVLWMVISMVYYGLSLSTASLAGNRFVNAFLSFLVEIPAFTSSYFALQKWGRRYPLIAYHCIAGVALILTQVIPKTVGDVSLVWLITTFNMIGKFGITGAFGIVFLYAPEIFPTTLRNQAMGISSLLGRVGNVCATYTPYVSVYVPWLPGPLFGGLSILAGLLVIFLPETHNRPLPQTIEDIENWSKTPTVAPVASKSADHELEAVNDVKPAKVV